MALGQRRAQFLLTAYFKCPFKKKIQNPWCCHSARRFSFSRLSTSLTLQLTVSWCNRETYWVSPCPAFPEGIRHMEMNANRSPWWDISWPLHTVGACLCSFIFGHSSSVPGSKNMCYHHERCLSDKTRWRTLPSLEFFVGKERCQRRESLDVRWQLGACPAEQTCSLAQARPLYTSCSLHKASLPGSNSISHCLCDIRQVCHLLSLDYLTCIIRHNNSRSTLGLLWEWN